MARTTPKGQKPPPLSAADRRTLARILKKARAFKAYYQNQRKSGQ